MNGYICLLILILSVILDIRLIGYLYGKISAAKAFILGLVLYFFSYVLFSACLFWMDLFSIHRCIVGILITELVISVVVHCKKITFGVCYIKKDLIFLICIVIFSSFVSSDKFEYFGMGQDQGVYQVKAIELINDNNQKIFKYDEIDVIKDENWRNLYREACQKQVGYDWIDVTMPFQANYDGSNCAGIFHGIPTWPAVLALFGDIFGINHMQDCQTILFACLLALCYFILENISTKIYMELAALLVLGLSPEMIWVSKSALTEMGLSVIIAAFVLLLTEKNIKLRALNYVPVIVFAFYHVSIYTVMPAFMLINWYMLFREQSNLYVNSSRYSLLGYIGGFYFMVYISPTYTINNYFVSLHKILPFITKSFVGIMVPIAVIICLCFTFFLSTFMNRHNGFHLRSRYGKAMMYGSKLFYGIVLILAFMVFFKEKNTIEGPGNFCLIALCVSTALFSIPLILWTIFFNKKTEVNPSVMCIRIFFDYVLIWSILLRPTIPYFYYYGRYITPFLLIIVAMLCSVSVDKRGIVFAVVCAIGILSFVLPDKFLLENHDHSHVEWSLVDTVLKYGYEQDSAVIIDDNLALYFTLILKSEGLSVYPVLDDIYVEESYLDGIYKNVYFLTDVENLDSHIDSGLNLTFNDVVLSGRYNNEMYLYSGDSVDSFSQYPKEQSSNECELRLYKYYVH